MVKDGESVGKVAEEMKAKCGLKANCDEAINVGIITDVDERWMVVVGRKYSFTRVGAT